jgi:peptide-methionine (S)-S-oxide reductase
MFRMLRKAPEMVSASDALKGREEPMDAGKNKHFILGNTLRPPFPDNVQVAVFGTGCFWGTEKGFWRLPGVYSTAVGYAGGFTPNPEYEEVCSGRTGHNECVHVAYDPSIVSYADLLRLFWESHDPTQGMGQGNDVGTQYRSGIYFYNEEQKALAEASKAVYEALLGGRPITTEIVPVGTFYYAEEYHQQYLAKPGSRPYCSAQPQGISLSPGDWVPDALKEKHGPKLPEGYWQKHGPKPGCTINFDNKQVSLASL